MKTLAIDPGYDRCGIAVLEKDGSGKECLLYSECFETDRAQSLAERLASLGEHLEGLIALHQPTHLALEELFFSKNQKTAMGVAQAVGMITYLAVRGGLMVFTYKPQEVKIAVAGHGKADKRDVILMTERLLSLKKAIKHDDEYDAIAVGLTHLASVKLSSFAKQ